VLEIRFERAQPAREERNRKRVRDREAKARGRLVLREARFDSGRLEASERIPHKRQERAAGAVELDGVRTTVDQVNADPLLQRPNVARERRLRDGARFSGPREVTGLGERDRSPRANRGPANGCRVPSVWK
jgi:hypothetical protein